MVKLARATGTLMLLTMQALPTELQPEPINLRLVPKWAILVPKTLSIFEILGHSFQRDDEVEGSYAHT